MTSQHNQNEPNERGEGLHRREVIKGAAAAGLVAATGTHPLVHAAASKAARSDLIKRENAKPGTRDWLLTKTRTVPGKINKILDNGRSQTIEGYCSANSVRAGETLKIMVSTKPASDFRLEIFRTGYYGGTGARLVKTFESLKGTPQPEPPVGDNYVRECQWEPAVELEIPHEWFSGVYLGKLTAKKSGIQSYVIFIVRDDRPCDLLFQCSDLTWSAYNRWPVDYSIYTEHKDWKSIGVPSGTVSFDRPYALFTHPVNRIKTSGGSGEYLPWEFPLAFWLEQHGYDVSYISNVDTHADPLGLLRTKGFISVGHDEYWSLEMYDNAIKARDAGAPKMDLPGMNVVAEGDALVNGEKVGHYTATLYDGPKDNVVFNAATIWWANGLSSPPGHVNPSRHGVTQQGPDPRVQQITHNLMRRIVASQV